MNTSLLILCACFAIAASRDSTRSSLDAFKAKEFHPFMANKGGAAYTFSLVRCANPTTLLFVATDKPRGILIEKDEACHPPVQISHDDRVNDQMNPINNNLPAIHFSTQRRTCKTFIVAVPAIPALVTELLVECIDP